MFCIYNYYTTVSTMDSVYPPLELLMGTPFLSLNSGHPDIKDIMLTKEDSIRDGQVTYELYSKKYRDIDNSIISYECKVTFVHPITQYPEHSVHFIGYYFERTHSFKVINTDILNTYILKDFKFPLINSMQICGGNLKKIPFENLPTTINKLIVENNKVESVEYVPKHINYMDLSRNKITHLDLAGSSLETLIVNHNELKQLTNLPVSLKHIQCSYNSFYEFPNISKLSYLSSFECCNNKVPLGNVKISNTLETLLLNFSGIQELTFTANNYANKLEIVGNNILNFKMPDRMTELYCTSNKNITLIPNECITKLHISGCDLVSLPILPKTLLELRACANFLDSIKTLPTPREDLNIFLNDNPIEKVYHEYFNSLTKK